MFRTIYRLFRQHRWTTFTAVTILATGMGLCFGIFSLFTTLVSPVQPGIVNARFVTLGISQARGPLAPMRWHDFERLRSAAGDTLWITGTSAPIEVGASIQNVAIKLRIEIVSSGYFAALGVNLLAGRSIQQNDEGPLSHVAVISRDLAQQSFGSPNAALNELITVEGTPFRIVGVAASPFQGALVPGTSVWLPPNAVIPTFVRLPEGYSGPLTELYRSSDLWARINVFYAIVRAKNAKNEDELIAQADAIGGRLLEMKLQSVRGIEVDPTHRAQLIAWTKLALVLSIALFLVAALNFSAFLTAQIPRRGQEIQMRRTLGAGFHHLCIEILRGPILLLSMSAVFGAGLAVLFRGLFSKLLISSQVVVWAQPIHWADIGFFTVLTFGGLLVVGGLPMIELLRTERAVLDSSRITSSKHARGLLLGVVGFQATISLLSVVSALFLVKSLQNWQKLDLGFQPSSVLVAQLGPKPGESVTLTVSSSGNFELATLTNLALQKIRSLPKVQTAAVADAIPLSHRPIFTKITKADGTTVRTEYNAVTSDYFRAMGIRMLQGRTFSTDSLTGEPSEAVVNVALAKSLWGDDQALNRIARVPIAPEADLEQGGRIPTASVRIVGIAEDTQYDGPTHSSAPLLYLRLAGSYMNQIPMFVVRGQMTSKTLELVVRDTFGNTIPGLTITDSFPLSRLVNQNFSLELLRATLAVIAASILLILSLIGAYGVTGFRIATRERELAIRICLGASLQSVIRLVLREVLFVALASLLLTVFVWILWSKTLIQYVYGIELWNPTVWSTGSSIWLCALLLASCVPGVRLMKLRPSDLLRSE
jgi:putative ABC transport system permease protein